MSASLTRPDSKIHVTSWLAFCCCTCSVNILPPWNLLSSYTDLLFLARAISSIIQCGGDNIVVKIRFFLAAPTILSTNRVLDTHWSAKHLHLTATGFPSLQLAFLHWLYIPPLLPCQGFCYPVLFDNCQLCSVIISLPVISVSWHEEDVWLYIPVHDFLWRTNLGCFLRSTDFSQSPADDKMPFASIFLWFLVIWPCFTNWMKPYLPLFLSSFSLGLVCQSMQLRRDPVSTYTCIDRSVLRR